MIVSGTVVRNLGRGRDLGYPTANIPYDGQLDDGVYFGFTRIGGEAEEYPSLIFIGPPETFEDWIRRMEIHILDFDRDIYGKEITVTVARRSRGNRKFRDAEALIAQMKRDEELGREFFASGNETDTSGPKPEVSG
jgi:riboflavin kinase/FMN adenylyltransferase